MTDTKPLMPQPISTATNSYDLLSELIVTIVTEPQRLLMKSWVVRWLGTNVAGSSWGHRTAAHLDPACGTVACAAGWIATLRQAFPKADTLVVRSTKTGNKVEHPVIAYNLVFNTEWLLHTFFPDAKWGASNCREDLRTLFGRTDDMAEDVVEELREIQTHYSDALRAFALPPLGTTMPSVRTAPIWIDEWDMPAGEK